MSTLTNPQVPFHTCGGRGKKRKEIKMSTIVLTEHADCSKCIHFELEGIEGVCNNFNMVIEDAEPLCSAYEKIKEED